MKKIITSLLFLLPIYLSAQCVAPADPQAPTLNVSCGSDALFQPVGGGNYFFYNNAAADSLIGIGSSFQINQLIGDTTIGVQEYTLGTQSPMAVSAQSSTFTGNVRGYYFISPVQAMITGVDVPTDASTGAQSIAIVRFNANPPLYSTTTNDFEVLYLTQNDPTAGIIPLNILIQPGDIIGVLGQRATVCSYGTGNFATTILGQATTISRLGMQFPLTTTAPQQLWTEAAGSISRVNLYFSEVCISDTVAFTAQVQDLAVAITSNVPTVCESGNVDFNVSGADNYTWNTGSVALSETYFIDSVTTLIVNGTNALGCSGADTLVFSPIANPVVSISSSNPNGVCENDTIQLDVTGALDYVWSNGEVTSTINYQSTATNTITVQGTDSNGCVSGDTLTIPLLSLPSVDLGTDVEQCEGTVMLDAGAGFAAYSWSNSGVNQFNSVSNSGDYSVMVTDSSGCSASDTITVTIHPNPTVTTQSSSLDLCEYAVDATLTGTPVGGTWTGTGVTGNSFDPSGHIGSNTLTYNYTDANDCSNSASVVITVDACADLNESLKNSFVIFPNPSSTSVTISAIPSDVVSVQIIDLLGKIVFEKQHFTFTGELTISVQDFITGEYILRLETTSEVLNQKLMIQQ
ncbi:MAG: T9SS type A sorting domain-containing protein [Fluviicola sp.]|nr:T9SS type A sorting domain-containing protein [Fluviicola sp.]